MALSSKVKALADAYDAAIASLGELTEDMALRIANAKHALEVDKIGMPPAWIVNDIAELGVRVNGENYFLYKGDSIVYGKNVDMKYRPVLKREFGETCKPLAAFASANPNFQGHPYTVTGVFTEGLSDGKPEDWGWRDISKSL